MPAHPPLRQRRGSRSQSACLRIRAGAGISQQSGQRVRRTPSDKGEGNKDASGPTHSRPVPHPLVEYASLRAPAAPRQQDGAMTVPCRFRHGQRSRSGHQPHMARPASLVRPGILPDLMLTGLPAPLCPGGRHMLHPSGTSLPWHRTHAPLPRVLPAIRRTACLPPRSFSAADTSVSALRLDKKKTPQQQLKGLCNMERETGFEPATSSLGS